ncbi:hypothetical protein [Paludisphaera mucosa]|uniref:SWIM-type domain-containing protein n=1 Tax=Paludisphaera mucosa TaxID=3030827 RepID=A0ABT6F4R3_9BACT|nr:hypothetical protein [Paludisphaera mucosa]MDG3002571.1 hypothetical protein [Paludisphaera mucosa]
MADHRARLTLILTIDGTGYVVRPIRTDDPDLIRAFRLIKAKNRRGSGPIYDIAEHSYGVTCDCPDFIWKREGLDPLGCIHIRAMRAVGLLPATVLN